MRKIIDAHCHIYPDKIALKASTATGTFYDIKCKCDGKVSTMLNEGEKAGVNHYIIQSVATTPTQVSSINHFIADEVEKHKGIMTGLGTMHPDCENKEKEIAEIVELGLKGVKLHPDIQGFKIDDYRMLKIYELCEKNNLVVLMHTGDNRYDFSNPNRMLPIIEIYENLTIIGAHFGGWSIWEEATNKLAEKKNFYVDCSSSLYALTPDLSSQIIRRYGSDKVLFGTDYPMWTPEEELERLFKLDLTENELEQILHLNAEKLFNI